MLALGCWLGLIKKEEKKTETPKQEIRVLAFMEISRLIDMVLVLLVTNMRRVLGLRPQAGEY